MYVALINKYVDAVCALPVPDAIRKLYMVIDLYEYEVYRARRTLRALRRMDA